MKNYLSKIRKEWVYVLILLFVIPAVLPILRLDFYHFSDEPHIANLYQMIRAFESGQFPPRLAPDMSYGYSYPLFNFYYPLAYYLGSLFFSFTGSLIVSLKLLFLLTVPLSAVFMYKWLREHVGRIPSFAGAIIYVYTPYRAVDLYIRGALGETFAFLFFPLVAFWAHRTFKNNTWRDTGIFAFVVGLFVLSHNLSPLFFIPWIFLYLVLLTYLNGDWRRLIKPFLGIVLGFALSSYWWAPAFLEKGLLVNVTPFYYKDHFPFIKQLIFPSWGYGASNPGIYDDMSFQIGIVNLGLVLFAVAVFVKRFFKNKKRKSLVLPGFYLASLAFLGFMMNIRSSFLWEISSFANYIQFPWRLLLMTTFLTSSLVIFWDRKFNKFILTLPILALILTFSYFKPSEYFSPNDDYFLNRFFANRTIDGERENLSKEYKNYSEDYLLLPLWVDERPTEFPASPIVSETAVVGEIETKNAVYYQAKVSASEKSLIEINKYFFPGWNVEIDGELADIETLKPHGNMGVWVEKGDHTIDVYWKETPLRKMFDVISLASLFAIFLLLVRGVKKSDAKNK